MFGLYIITTGISFGVFFLSSKAYNDFIERKGYVSTEKEKSVAELNFNILSYAFKALIPGYNIYSAIQILWTGSKHFEESLQDEIKKGNLRRITEADLTEDINTNSNQYVSPEECLGFEPNRHYEEMTNDEKLAFLEKEKEFLLQEKENANVSKQNMVDEDKEKARIRSYYIRTK